MASSKRHAPHGLNIKQARFVVEYLKDLNATQAAIRAGYSKKGADVVGSRLLGHTRVASAIAKGVAQHLAKNELTASRTLEELRRVGFSDIGVFFDARGRLRPLHKLTSEERSVLAASKILKTNLVSGDGRREEVHEIKLWNKLQALEMLAKYFKLLEEQIHVTGDWEKLAQRLASARQRA